MERGTDEGLQLGVWIFHAFSGTPPPPGISASSQSSLNPPFGFLEALLHRHAWLNHSPLVLNLTCSPSPLPCLGLLLWPTPIQKFPTGCQPSVSSFIHKKKERKGKKTHFGDSKNFRNFNNKETGAKTKYIFHDITVSLSFKIIMALFPFLFFILIFKWLLVNAKLNQKVVSQQNC